MELTKKTESHSVVPESLNHMDYTVHGILQVRILDWAVMPSSGDLPDPAIKPISLSFPALAGMFFTTNATWEALYAEYVQQNAGMDE